jgi:hypothetical protein
MAILLSLIYYNLKECCQKSNMLGEYTLKHGKLYDDLSPKRQLFTTEEAPHVMRMKSTSSVIKTRKATMPIEMMI